MKKTISFRLISAFLVLKERDFLLFFKIYLFAFFVCFVTYKRYFEVNSRLSQAITFILF